ncbi:hypothetical protein, partial [Salinicola peritrichatus]|uniref:hypothetical protein n=1 Tax=Salinicola peritrichatus TaxID=1267424 RepID=UPI001EF76832
MTGPILLRGTHIEEIPRPRVIQESWQIISGKPAHASTFGNVQCPDTGPDPLMRTLASVLVLIAALLTDLEIESFQRPANGAVAQRAYWISDTGVDERLGADDATPTST